MYVVLLHLTFLVKVPVPCVPGYLWSVVYMYESYTYIHVVQLYEDLQHVNLLQTTQYVCMYTVPGTEWFILHYRCILLLYQVSIVVINSTSTLPPAQFGARLLHAPVGHFERDGLNISCGCTTKNSYSGFFKVCNPRFNCECQFFPCNMEFFRFGPYVAGSKINNCVSGRCAVPRIEMPTTTRLCPLCCMYIGNFDDIRTRC